MDETVPAWKSSAFCAGNGACAEVAVLPSGDVALRDGKAGEQSPVLTFPRAAWDAFCAGIKAGELQ